MKSHLSIWLAGILSVFLLVGFAGCTQQPADSAPTEPASSADASGEDSAPVAEAPAELAEGGTLVVGLDDTFAPMGFRDEGGNLVGFDIDLANAVGEQMGVEIQFQPIDWDSKEMELEAKKIDCIWNGMSRTPAREQSMTLSQNYLNNKIIIMTTPDVEITAKEQLAEYQIGTQAKSSALEVLQADSIFPDIEANLSEYRTYDECILDMLAGRIQVMVVDEVHGQYKNNNLDTKLNVATVDLGPDFYTIGFRKEDQALCSQVEAAIKALQESGKGKEISEKWFGIDLLLPIQ